MPLPCSCLSTAFSCLATAFSCLATAFLPPFPVFPLPCHCLSASFHLSLIVMCLQCHVSTLVNSNTCPRPTTHCLCLRRWCSFSLPCRRRRLATAFLPPFTAFSLKDCDTAFRWILPPFTAFHRGTAGGARHRKLPELPLLPALLRLRLHPRHAAQAPGRALAGRHLGHATAL